MMVSSKGEYAARALLYLALVAPDGKRPVRAAEIAAEQGIPQKYLHQILLLFKKAGLVVSKPGLNGGYALARPAQEITMAQVICAADGSLAAVECANMAAGMTCNHADGSACALRMVWEEVGQAVARVLERTTLEQVAMRARELTRTSVPMYYI
jgi:Rrf2 family protein